MFVGNQPLSSDPPDVATYCGANCFDYTKNKTRKNIKISEKKTVSERRCVYVCVAPLRKVWHPQGNKGLKLAELSVPLLLLLYCGRQGLNV